MRRSLLAFLAVVFASVAVFGAQAVPVAASSPSVAPVVDAISWKSCGNSGFQCATIAVPIDYSNPAAGNINLAMMRLPARDQSQRIGSLLANPGGPGGSALDFLQGWAPLLSSDIRNRFDLVAFDPRGVGQSTPIICHDSLQQFVAADPSPDNAQEWTQTEQVSQKFADDCEAKYPNILPFLGTKNVARDMETIRQALGEDKLTYVGYSYGTAIGEVYADMYPTHVRAFVLDGAIDLSQSFEAQNETQAVGFERAYQSYLTNCRNTHCALTADGDPGAAVDKLLAQVETKPIPSHADRPAGPGETLLGIIAAMYSQSEWGSLTDALTEAIAGNGTGMVNLADQYLERNPNGSYPNLIEANAAVNFDDETCPKDPAAYMAMATEFAKASPHFGESSASAGLLCAYWPTTPDPLTAPKAAGAPPIIVVDTTNDPATPYEWGLAVSKQLESGHLIIHRGEGHTIYAQGDSCVDSAVNAYLVNLTVPPAGLTCGNGPPPPEDASPAAGSPTATPGTGASTPQPAATRTTTQTAPGAPNTGGSSDSGATKGNGGIAVMAGVFLLAALACAAGVMLYQRRE